MNDARIALIAPTSNGIPAAEKRAVSSAMRAARIVS